MRSSRSDWIVQNRHWLGNLAAAIVLALILISVSLCSLFDIANYWARRLRSDRASIAEVHRELSLVATQIQIVSHSLDSLLQMNHSDNSDQMILSAIRKSCGTHSIALSAYDRLQLGAIPVNKSASYRLLVHGDFRDMLLLIEELESSPLTLTVRSLTLEKEFTDSQRLNGVLVVSSET